MTRILFVCHGNICRSTMAEFVMKDMVQKAGLAAKYDIHSAAVTTEQIGCPVYPPVRVLLSQAGISCEGKTARLMTAADYTAFDLLIGMDDDNLVRMKRICGGDPDGKMHLLMAYAGERRGVADPWYTRDFDATWHDVNAGCRALLEQTR